ncbi:MAG: FG-GAP repeat protein [candidate division Zixibacteria bacterium]|nr:FG-GAP repeat protein [candidate division Zixibacteria bacterium]
MLCTLLVVACRPAFAEKFAPKYVAPHVGIDSVDRILVIQDIRDSTLFGRTTVPVGDWNDDGVTDVLLCRYGYSGSDDNAYLFYGGNPPDGAYDAEYVNLYSLMNAVGDVNRDGYLDIGLCQLPDLIFELHLGGPLMDDTADFLIPHIYSRIARAADFDADGNLELPLATDLNGGYVNFYDMEEGRDTIPEYVIPDTSRSFGQQLAVGDFNGDTFPDLTVSAYYGRDTCFVKFYWGGPAFDTIADFEIHSTSPKFGRTLTPLGDFNGDEYEDILIAGGANDPYGIYFGGPAMDDEIDIVVNMAYGGDPPDAADCVGDINNDGYPDLVWGYILYEEVYVYLGGPDADSLVDLVWGNLDLDGAQAYYGREVRGVGDVNDDGIDDFAVYSRTNDGAIWYGQVDFYAGWDTTAVDINEGQNVLLPDRIKLRQNYPNPFNPSTTVEFDLPYRMDIRLSIHNVLGQEVRMLVSGSLGAGVHRATWNGADEAGIAMSSGVYFVKLQSGLQTAGCKIMLLR